MSKWISVNDRLPANNVDVLCWYKYFRYGDDNCMRRTYGIGFCHYGTWIGEVAQGVGARVIAWMPLPEPPEGEDNEN